MACAGSSNSELYDRDFFEWTRATAAAIREGEFGSIAREAVAEEIEDMGKRDYSEAASRAELILSHLLKWQLQPERRSVSWRVTIDTQRSSLLRKFDQSPSLRRRLVNDLPEIYRDAVLSAVAQTELEETAFPGECPWSFDQMLDRRFLPDELRPVGTPIASSPPVPFRLTPTTKAASVFFVEVTVQIPDDIAARLAEAGDLSRRTLESFALEELKAGRITEPELGRMLGLARLQIDGFLKSRGICEDYTMADFEQERAALKSLGQ